MPRDPGVRWRDRDGHAGPDGRHVRSVGGRDMVAKYPRCDLADYGLNGLSRLDHDDPIQSSGRGADALRCSWF